MKIIDNFLEHNVFQKLQDDVRFKLKWNYNDGIDYFEPDGRGHEKPTEEELKKDKFQFVHTFYKDSQPFSDSISILDPVFLKLQPQVIARVKANILTRTPKIIENELLKSVDNETNYIGGNPNGAITMKRLTLLEF